MSLHTPNGYAQSPSEDNSGRSNDGSVVGAFQDSYGNTVDDSVTTTNKSFANGNDLSDDDGTDIDDQDGLDIDDNDGVDTDTFTGWSGNESTFDATSDTTVGSYNSHTVDKSFDVAIDGSGNETVNKTVTFDVDKTSMVDIDDDDSYAEHSNNTTTSSTSGSWNHAADNSGNETTTVDVDVDLNFEDNDLIDIEHLTGRIEDIFSIGGSGNAFTSASNQMLEDKDFLESPSVVNACGTCFDQDASNIFGGEGRATSDWGSAGPNSDVAASVSASGDAAANLTAFDQSIEMGANVQYASVDMSVVGGSDDASVFGDDS